MTLDKKEPAFEFEPSVSFEHQSDPTPFELDKPRWSKPEITSFKPLAEAENFRCCRLGDGYNNAS